MKPYGRFKTLPKELWEKTEKEFRRAWKKLWRG